MNCAPWKIGAPSVASVGAAAAFAAPGAGRAGVVGVWGVAGGEGDGNGLGVCATSGVTPMTAAITSRAAARRPGIIVPIIKLAP